MKHLNSIFVIGRHGLLFCLGITLVGCVSAPVQQKSPTITAGNQYGITPTCPEKPVTVTADKKGDKAGTKVSKQVPVDEKANDQGEPNNINNKADKQNVRTDCVPKGIIQLAESFSIDPELKQQFDQAVDLLKREQFQESIEMFKVVTAKLNRFTAPHINLGIAYTRVGEWDKAEASFKEAIKLNEAHPVANNQLGLVYRRKGKYAEARTVYETLIQRFPGFWPARRNLGVLCDIYLQDLNCALEQYETYAKAKPEDEKMKIWIADVKGRMK